jgi:two-component sensor histidine kinase
MVSEIATNAVRHTASGGEDGWFDITVCAIGDGARISVGNAAGRRCRGYPVTAGSLM